MKKVGRLPVDKSGNVVCGAVVKTKNEANQILEIRKVNKLAKQNSVRLQFIHDVLKAKFG